MIYDLRFDPGHPQPADIAAGASSQPSWQQRQSKYTDSVPGTHRRKPPKTFAAILDPLEAAAEHEHYVSALINAIYHEAYENRDYRTMKFLDWFVDEQREEEDNAHKLVSRYKLFGTDAKGLYMLDQEYAGRVYSAPSLVL